MTQLRFVSIALFASFSTLLASQSAQADKSSIPGWAAIGGQTPGSTTAGEVIVTPPPDVGASGTLLLKGESIPSQDDAFRIATCRTETNGEITKGSCKESTRGLLNISQALATGVYQIWMGSMTTFVTITPGKETVVELTKFTFPTRSLPYKVQVAWDLTNPDMQKLAAQTSRVYQLSYDRNSKFCRYGWTETQVTGITQYCDTLANGSTFDYQTKLFQFNPDGSMAMKWLLDWDNRKTPMGRIDFVAAGRIDVASVQAGQSYLVLPGTYIFKFVTEGSGKVEEQFGIQAK